MKILFAMKHPGATRNFESTLRGLAERGHELTLVFDREKGGSAVAIVERLRADFATVRVVRPPKIPKDLRRSVARGLRLTLDYFRYLEPRYADAPALRRRAEQSAPRPVRLVRRIPLLRGPRGIALASEVLRTAERALPTPPALDDFIRGQAPDVLLVTPLVGLGSMQAEYVRSAQKLGIPAGLLVHSWDNLTNKGLIRDAPDLVAVWNEAQAREAVDLHGVPRDRVAVTGAASYDHWFEWRPSRSREEFCAEAGLPPDEPIVLYLCSSPFIAPDETAFVRRWIEGLRAAGGVVAGAGILVRPHPQNAAQWEDDPLADLDRVAVWPRTGADPVDAGARADYFDSIYHASAVVGINTSALIESGIVGRPVLTLLSPEFEGTQRGTLHFRYLVEVAGGLLYVAETMEDHTAQLKQAIERGIEGDHARKFVEAFVRPLGLERPATPELVAAVERLTAVKPTWRRVPFLGWLAEALLTRSRAQPASAPPPVSAAAASRSAPDDPLAVPKRAVKKLARSDGPVVAGPYVSEVGYELLYWIPFLRWATERHPELVERLTVVSRGGTASWYAGVAGRYVELYEHFPPDELHRRLATIETETRGYRKQYAVTSLDREILDAVGESLGLASFATLHPSTMFTAYRALVKHGSLHRKDTIFSFRPIEPPPLGEIAAELPDEYVAARFYFSAAFPDVPENRRFVASTLAALGRSAPVVLLTPGGTYDDHLDAEAPDAGWLHRVDHLMNPADNLATQTAVVAGASALVGTYGGLSYLGPLLGIPTLAFYSDPARFRPQHLEIAQRAFRTAPFGRFLAVDVADADLLRLVLGEGLAALREAS